MLPAIGLDHEVMLDAGEVHDETPGRMLAANLVVREAPAAQARSEPRRSGIRHGDAQRARLSIRQGGRA